MCSFYVYGDGCMYVRVRVFVFFSFFFLFIDPTIFFLSSLVGKRRGGGREDSVDKKGWVHVCSKAEKLVFPLPTREQLGTKEGKKDSRRKVMCVWMYVSVRLGGMFDDQTGGKDD